MAEINQASEALTYLVMFIMIAVFGFVIYYFILKERPVNYDAEAVAKAEADAKAKAVVTPTK